MNTFTHPRFRLGWILLLIGLVNGLFWTLWRWNFENNYTQTQITLDFEDTRSLADAYNQSQYGLLKDFRERGASSLAIYDQSLGSLRDNGRLAISSREIAQRSYPNLGWASVPANYRFLVTSDDPALIQQIFPRLVEQGSPSAPPLQRVTVAVAPGTSSATAPVGILIPASKQLINDAQVGFDSQQIDLAKRLGFSVTARISNALNLTPARLNTLLDSVQKQAGARIVLFSGNETLGYESLLSGAAREMRRRGLVFTNIEFSKQIGSPDFAKNTEGMLVRVHSVEGDEASRAKPEVLVDRFVRAVKDRNMRVLYVRLPRQQKGEPAEIAPGDALAPLQLKTSAYQQNLEFVEKISTEIVEPVRFLGFIPLGALRPPMELGTAQAFGDYPNSQLEPVVGARGSQIVRYLSRLGSGLGVVGATLLLLNLFFDWTERARRNWLIAGLVTVAALSVSAGKGAQIMALMAGIAAPVVAILWSGMPLVWDGHLKPRGKGLLAQWKWAFGLLAGTTILVIAMSLLVVALLNNWRYMSKADEFLGEKATQFLPLLLIPLAFLGELFPHRVIRAGATEGRARALGRINRFVEQPFNLRFVLVSFLVLGVGYVWMARFGNESGMTISSLELALRGGLEKVFIARPRTKEIMLGHPAFFAALWFMWRGQRWPAFAALIPATIGMADVLNTMCHIHTPLFYSLWRTLSGILLGSLAGLFVLWILNGALIGRFIKPRRGFVDESPATETTFVERQAGLVEAGR